MWTGPVGLAETNSRLIRVPRSRVGAAVRRAGLDDGARDLTLGGCADRDVDEARTGDLDRGDPVDAR